MPLDGGPSTVYARLEEPKMLVRNHGGRPASTGRLRTNAGRLCPGGIPTYVSPGIMHSLGGIPNLGGLARSGLCMWGSIG